MMQIIADKESVHIDLGGTEFKPGEMTTDCMRIIESVVLMMERVEEFEANKNYIRQRQYEALEVWKNAILGMEIAVCEDLTNDQMRHCREIVEDFMVEYQTAMRKDGKVS